MFIGCQCHRDNMATAKTGSFYLTETVQLNNGLASGQRAQGSIDLGAYVSVAQGLCIAVESVDFIYQASTSNGGAVVDLMAGNGAITAQLTDLNPGTALIVANNQSLVASGSLNCSFTSGIASHSSDFYPDNFGPAAHSESFMVVNDTLYLCAGPDAASIGGSDVQVTVRIRCRVVKLSNKDWMAIAIQSTAADN